MKLFAALGIAAVAAAADPPMPGELVDIGNGRRLHLYCQGSGSPTVLSLNGLPRYSFHWTFVQPEVAKFTSVCVYDRAGDAWSDKGPDQYSIEASSTIWKRSWTA